MPTRTCFALPGRLQEHPNDYSDQLLHPVARLGAQGAACGAVFQAGDLGRCAPPNHVPQTARRSAVLGGPSLSLRNAARIRDWETQVYTHYIVFHE